MGAFRLASALDGLLRLCMGRLSSPRPMPEATDAAPSVGGRSSPSANVLVVPATVDASRRRRSTLLRSVFGLVGLNSVAPLYRSTPAHQHSDVREAAQAQAAPDRSPEVLRLCARVDRPMSPRAMLINATVGLVQSYAMAFCSQTLNCERVRPGHVHFYFDDFGIFPTTRCGEQSSCGSRACLGLSGIGAQAKAEEERALSARWPQRATCRVFPR